MEPQQCIHTFKTPPWVQADRDGEGSPTESGMSMDSIPMRKRSRKPKHVYNAADALKACRLPMQIFLLTKGPLHLNLAHTCQE